MTALWSIVTKELRQTFRDKRMLALLAIAPLIQLIVLGYAVNMEVERVPTVVADEDRTPESRRFVSGLLAGDAFVPAGDAADADEALALLSRGAAPIAVVVPRGYGRRVAAGRAAQVQVLVDGGDSNRAIVAQNAVAAYGLGVGLARAGERVAALSRASGAQVALSTVRVEPRVLYNPTLSSRVYFVPGVAATLLIVVTTIVTAMGLAREREMGTLEQVMVTPIGPTTLVIGKTLPYAFIGLLDLGLVVAAGAAVFGVPLRGDLWLLVPSGLLYLLATLGFGLLVSTVAKNQQQALSGAFLFIMPAILLSGFITPVENMPEWLQPLTTLDPARHFVEVMRAVLLKDASLAELAPQMVAMGGIGLSVFALSAGLLRRRLT